VPIAWGALQGLRRRELNVDELVVIAIAAAVFIGEYWGAALVAFMMLFGKVLEDVTAARAEGALEGLGRLIPDLAYVSANDSEAAGDLHAVPVAQLKNGDIVVVRPGERIPADGLIIGGAAAVEEAAISGESVPVPKAAGDTVFAGTLATGGALRLRVERTGEATVLGRIAALVQEAATERAPIVRAADRWAKWFTPAVLALAGAVYLATGALLPAVTVLVVACPCALVLATPTAIVAGIACGARRGILIRGGARLEAAGRVDVVCLDKTGTLTTGRPSVRRIVVLASGASRNGAGGADDPNGQEATTARLALAYAAAAEGLSEHPLARAVQVAAQERGAARPAVDTEIRAFRAVPGRGVVATVPRLVAGSTGDPIAGHTSGQTAGQTAGQTTADVTVVVGRPDFLVEQGIDWPAAADDALNDLDAAGETPLVVALDGRAVAIIGVADTPRPEAAAALAALRNAGVQQIVLLTGDRHGAALAAARAVGIAPGDVHAGLLPEGKVEWVQRLRAAGHRVAMVGDGVNDAPALATADVAVAMGVAGTDLAMAASDIVLLTDDLRQAAAAIVLSRKTLAIIRQNLALAGVWNLAAIAVAAAGGMGPVGAALVHNLGSVAVVMNAARLVGARIDLPR
jgi:Zn2+/Cd2+-exporting ATPase